MSDRNQLLIEQFNLIDKDGNGVLSKEEIHNAKKASNVHVDVDKLIKYVATDEDGRVDCDEFLRLVTLEEIGSTIFEKLDKDKMGSVSREEVMDALNDFQNCIDSKKLFDLLAVTKENELNKDDFIAVWLSADLIGEYKLRQTFHSIDKDGNGFLSEAEIKEAAKVITKVVNVQNLLKYAKHDDDGKVSYQEFIQVLKYSKLFARIDGNKDGGLTEREITMAFGIVDREKRKALKLDVKHDEDRKLDFHEFMMVMTK